MDPRGCAHPAVLRIARPVPSRLVTIIPPLWQERIRISSMKTTTANTAHQESSASADPARTAGFRPSRYWLDCLCVRVPLILEQGQKIFVLCRRNGSASGPNFETDPKSRELKHSETTS